MAYGGGPTVDSARTIDINEMIRSGTIQRGADVRCSIVWRHNWTKEVTREVVVEAFLSDPERPHLRLIHLVEDRLVQSLSLTSTPQHLGGERLWFRCPVTGNRVGTLHMPPGGNHFASREAWGITYRSQRSSPHDRACARMHKMREALGAERGNLQPISKPHRMHWSTFDAKMAKLNKVEARALGFLVSAIGALQRRVVRNTGR